MEITIDKKNYMTVTHSAGYVTDENDVIYPFSVEVIDEEDEDVKIEVLWDDDIPENSDELENEIKESVQQ